MNIQIIDNHAYENYQKGQPPTRHVAKEISAIDPFDGEITNTEIGICVVVALLVLYALWRSFKS
ncbi:MAG: hypothetical protein NT123_23285 [Proteobacteria bacterium]|nr:hypothetical protein [Pseudomonadota bacterium]